VCVCVFSDSVLDEMKGLVRLRGVCSLLGGARYRERENPKESEIKREVDCQRERARASERGNVTARESERQRVFARERAKQNERERQRANACERERVCTRARKSE